MSTSSLIRKQSHFLNDPVSDLIDFLMQQFVLSWLARSNKADATHACDAATQSLKRTLFICDEILGNQPFLIKDCPGNVDYELSHLLGRIGDKLAVPDLRMLTNLSRWMNEIQTAHNDAGADSTPASGFPAYHKLLQEIGSTYVRYLLANAEAVSTNAENVKLTVSGETWRETPNPRQMHVLHYIQRTFLGLSGEDKRRSFDLLEGTGCSILFW